MWGSGPTTTLTAILANASGFDRLTSKSFYEPTIQGNNVVLGLLPYWCKGISRRAETPGNPSFPGFPLKFKCLDGRIGTGNCINFRKISAEPKGSISGKNSSKIWIGDAFQQQHKQCGQLLPAMQIEIREYVSPVNLRSGRFRGSWKNMLEREYMALQDFQVFLGSIIRPKRDGEARNFA